MIELGPIDNAEPRRLAAEKNVFTNGQFLNQRQLLEDDCDARRLRIAYALELPRLIIYKNLAFERARRINTRKHLHQRRFSRTVLSYQGMKFSCIKRKADAVKRPNAGELLDDVAHFEKWHTVLPILYTQKVCPNKPRSNPFCAKSVSFRRRLNF